MVPETARIQPVILGAKLHQPVGLAAVARLSHGHHRWKLAHGLSRLGQQRLDAVAGQPHPRENHCRGNLVDRGKSSGQRLGHSHFKTVGFELGEQGRHRAGLGDEQDALHACAR